jgi:membrane protein implicated in regulation of membrane protease activity
MNATQGLSGAARRVADHARSLVRLELQLAATEIKRKLADLAAGIGLIATAALLAVFALGFALAAAAAALATELKVWQALLVVFGALVIVAALLAAIGATLLRRGSSPVPAKALEEARLTTEALRNGR